MFISQLQGSSLIADKGYDAQKRVITPLIERQIMVVIPSTRNRKQSRTYDKYIYQARNLIENFFVKLKQFRGIATRYDKRSVSFLSAIYLVASVILLA